MEQRPDTSRANRQIQEEAAEWLIHFNADEPDAAARADFDRWLRVSPEHIRAYLELLPLWQDTAALADVSTMSREALIALATGAGANVSVLRHHERGRTEARAMRPRYLRLLAAAAAVIMAVAAAFWLQSRSGHQVYRTGIAEIRSITLEDGTRLSIGARSAVTVAYSASARALQLDAGDIYVDVAKDSSRPLTVEVKDKVIRALGTQFEVRSDDRTMRVSVIEGSVSVSEGAVLALNAQSPSESSPQTVLLRAGQQLTSRPAGPMPAPQQIKSREPAAWRTGRLVFDDADLGEVIREFNRYNRRPFRLADPALEAIPIAAAFSSADPAPLIRFLEEQPGVSVSEQPDEILVETR